MATEMESQPLTGGKSIRGAHKSTIWYQVANAIQGVIALGIIATACVVIGMGFKSEDDGKGGLNFYVDIVTNREIDRKLYMYAFLGAAGLLWGLIFLLEVIVDAECSLKWIFGSTVNNRIIAILSMRNRALIRDVATFFSWWAINWSLSMSTGETNGLVLIYEALVFSSAIGFIVVSRFIGFSLKYKPTDTADDVTHKHRAFGIIGLSYWATTLLFTSIFFRHLNYAQDNKGTGSNLEKNSVLLSAHWLFTVCVAIFYFNDSSDALLKAWNHVGAVGKFLCMPAFWPNLIFGWILSKLREINRDMTESIIGLFVNTTVHVAVPAMLFTEVIDKILTST